MANLGVVNIARRTWDKAAAAAAAAARAAGLLADGQAAEAPALHPVRAALQAGADARASRPSALAPASAPPPSSSSSSASSSSSSAAASFAVAEASRPALAGARGPEGSQRAFLPSRDAAALQLEARLNKRRLVTEATPASQSGGYWCDVCECSLRDSTVYLDHINGRSHQRKLGFSMRVEKSSVSAVQLRLQAARAEEASARAHAADTEDRAFEDYEARVGALDDEERARKRAKRNAQRAAAAAAAAAPAPGAAGAVAGEGLGAEAVKGLSATATAVAEPEAAEDDEAREAREMAAALGFGAFL